MILTEEASLLELPLVAQKIKKCLETPCVIILAGAMGSGKTTFVQAFTGERASSASPTYSLINTMGDIVHADFYRIESEKELDYLEISHYQGCQYAFIEWGKPLTHKIKREFGNYFSYYVLEIDENCVKTYARKYTLRGC